MYLHLPDRANTHPVSAMINASSSICQKLGASLRKGTNTFCQSPSLGGWRKTACHSCLHSVDVLKRQHRMTSINQSDLRTPQRDLIWGSSSLGGRTTSYECQIGLDCQGWQNQKAEQLKPLVFANSDWPIPATIKLLMPKFVCGSLLVSQTNWHRQLVLGDFASTLGGISMTNTSCCLSFYLTLGGISVTNTRC